MSDLYTQRLAQEAIEEFQRRKEEEENKKYERAEAVAEVATDQVPWMEMAQQAAHENAASIAQEIAAHASGELVVQKGWCLAEASMEVLGGASCFVATASLGSDQHPDLTDLRAFRDQKLLPSTMGRWFVRFYYRWGQYIANAIRHRPFLCWVVREGLIRPIARFSRYCIKH